MSNPTANFGWVMPDPVDLVTNLPADFEVFGQAVDTSLADLKGGTTGQVLKKNTNADMDFVWGADSAGMTNPMTTTGDLIYSSPGSTPVRLGIGTANQLLAVNSGATAPEWVTPSSGGMTLLSTTTLSGVSTTISSISSAYTNLQIYIYGITGNVSDQPVRVWFNADTGGGWATGVRFSGTAVVYGQNADRLSVFGYSTSRTYSTNAAVINISNYSNTSGRKPLEIYGYCISTGVADGVINQAGYFQGTAAVSSVTFDYGGTQTFAGGTVLIYGVK